MNDKTAAQKIRKTFTYLLLTMSFYSEMLKDPNFNINDIPASFIDDLEQIAKNIKSLKNQSESNDDT